MPKKSAKKKRIVSGKHPRHFLWSTFFIAITAAVNIYLIGTFRTLGESYTWPLLVVILAVITLLVIGYEKRAGKMRNGKFLWSIFFAAFTAAAVLYSGYGTGFTMWPVMAVGSAIISLALLVHEKYA